MKLSMIVAVFSLAFFPVVDSLAAPIQDLDRINEIVNQVRGLADDAGEQSVRVQAIGVNEPGKTPRKNPFSVEPNTPIGNDSSTPPAVDVGPEAIRINAGGRQFNIPRLGTGYKDSNIDVARAPALKNGMNVEGRTGQPTNLGAALETAKNYRIFSDAVREFRNGKYALALTIMKQFNETKSDGIADQFLALCLFAQGDYLKSAESEYAAASQTPLFHWEQLRSYYGDPGAYGQQYQRLKDVVADKDSNHSLRFLLGCHHLMLGHRESASREFEFVLTKLPNDPVVRRLLRISQQIPPAPN